MLANVSRSIVRGRPSRLLSSIRHTSIYHPKVRAFDFALSLEALLPMLKVYTALYLWKYRKTSEKRMGLFQHLFEVALTQGESDPSRPPRIWIERTQAMYLPAWMIDASVVAKADRITASGVEPALVTVASENSYFPGFSSEPLSRMGLGEGLDYGVAVPFSDQLRKQHGQDITCVPFTLAPFPLFSLCRLAGLIDVTKNLRMDMSSAQANMMAAYPVLVPVYLIEFRVKTGDETECYTVVCQAATMWSPYIIDDYIELLARDPIVARKTSFLPSPFVDGLRAMRSFANISCKVVSNTTIGIPISVPSRAISARLTYLSNNIGTMRGATQAYENWLLKSRDGPGVAKPIDWDDLRIRPFTDEECRRNRVWMELDNNVQRARWLIANAKVGSDKIHPTIHNTFELLSRASEKDMRPEWLRQWHARPDKKDDGYT